MRRLAIPARRPADDLLEVVRESVLEAFPTRAPALLRAIECLGWGEPHSPALERVPHCRFCAAVEGTVSTLPLVPRLFARRICSRCVTLCHGLLVEARVGREPPSFEIAVAEIVRALRAHGGEEGERAVAKLEARLAGGRVPTPCQLCGPKVPWPREESAEDRCLLCEAGRDGETRLILGPSTAVCERCVEACFRHV